MMLPCISKLKLGLEASRRLVVPVPTSQPGPEPLMEAVFAEGIQMVVTVHMSYLVRKLCR